MNRPLRIALAIAAATSVALLGACGDDGDEDATDATTADAELTVSDVWARAATDLTASDRTAVYLQITAGDDGDELVSASVPDDVAGTVELHETTVEADGVPDADDPPTSPDAGDLGGDDATEPAPGVIDGDDTEMGDSAMDDGAMDDSDQHGGMMQMRQVDSIAIPAGETVSFEPGGLHLMLVDLATELEPGDTVEVTLVFAEAGEMTVTAEVRDS